MLKDKRSCFSQCERSTVQLPYVVNIIDICKPSIQFWSVILLSVVYAKEIRKIYYAPINVKQGEGMYQQSNSTVFVELVQELSFCES